MACTSPLGAAGFALGIAGGWWAIAKPGPRRWYGVIGMVVGAAVLIAALLGAGAEDWESFVRAFICLALLAIAVFAARAALAASLRTTAAGRAHRVRPTLAPGIAVQPVVGWRQGREVRLGGAGHFPRSSDRDARPRARPRGAGPRRHRPGRRLPGDGRWRWLTSIGGLHRRGARSSLRVRGRRDAKPLRPRPRTGSHATLARACTPSAMPSSAESTTRR